MASLPNAASLGQLAVVLEVVSREEHRELCRMVQSSTHKGRPVSYARLLVRRGVPPRAVEELLQRGASLAAVRCDACGASVPQEDLTKRREYPCLRCGALLLGFRAYSEERVTARPRPRREPSYHRAPGSAPPKQGELELETPTIVHGQVLPLPGEPGRRRDLELPTPSGRLGERRSGDTTAPLDDQGTALYREVLGPGPHELGGGLTTIHFGDVFRLPSRPPNELSDEDLVSAFETLASDQGVVGAEAAPEEYAEIGGFRVTAALGEGGMGRVYLARQRKTGREVALKVLRSTLATDREFLERFHREAHAVTDSAHPNVVQMVASGHDQHYDMHYIAFEYVPGGTLEDLISAEGSLLEFEALQVALGIARGLEFTSGLGIVHRDVKPSNVIMAADRTPKLADLGLARHLDQTTRVTQAGVVLGTPAYIAPEQAIDVEDLDVRADIYALGVCLYEMLTGKLPLEDDVNTTELLLRHVEEDVPDVRLEAPGVSAATAQLVKGLTARKREKRYPTPSAAVFDIERVIGGEEPLGPKGAARRVSAKRPTQRKDVLPPPRAPEAPRAPRPASEPQPAARAPQPAPPPPAADRAPSPGRRGSGLGILLFLVLLFLATLTGALGAAWYLGWLPHLGF